MNFNNDDHGDGGGSRNFLQNGTDRTCGTGNRYPEMTPLGPEGYEIGMLTTDGALIGRIDGPRGLARQSEDVPPANPCVSKDGYRHDEQQEPSLSPPGISMAACGGGHLSLVLRGGRLMMFGCRREGMLRFGEGGGALERDTIAVSFSRSCPICRARKRRAVGCHRRQGRANKQAKRSAGSGAGGSGRVCQVVELQAKTKRLSLQTSGGRRDAIAPLPPEADLRIQVRRVSCGDFHTAAVDWSGAVWTWGRGQGGRLGHGNHHPCSVPRRVR